MCPPKFEGHERCPRGTVDWTALGLTPTDEGVDVDIDPSGANTCHCHLNKGFLDAGEPLLVGVVESVAI
jgi:hypothetical protein